VGLTVVQLLHWLEKRLPHPRLEPNAQLPSLNCINRIIVFARLPNPTFDYYFAARLSAANMPPFEVVDIRRIAEVDLDAQGAFVIICRYASPSLLAWLEKSASLVSGVGLFVDDDMAAIVTGNEATLRYRAMLLFRGLLPLRRLNKFLDVIWVSTSVLADRLGEDQCRVLPPAPPASLWKELEGRPHIRAKPNEITIAYHATAIHVDEHRFLRPIIEYVLRERPNARFEVFVGKKTIRLWSGIDRVKIRTAMSWPDYLAEGAISKIDIMLVPLAPSRVNDCRAGTKRIDVARFGAAGIFSASEAYGTENTLGELILPYDPVQWCQALLNLIDNESARMQAAEATLARVTEMSEIALHIPIFLCKG
jgi:hypothetical protein